MLTTQVRNEIKNILVNVQNKTIIVDNDIEKILKVTEYYGRQELKN